MLNVEFGFVNKPGYAPPINQMAQKTSSLNELMENTFSSLILSDTGEIYRVLKALVMELDQAEADDKYIVHLLFCELLLRVAEQRKEQLNARERPVQLYVRKSIEFLHQNYDRSIQAKDVAAAVNLHHGYLQRIFKSHTGRTLTDYLTMLRMKKAKQLLGQSDISVAEIADYVGISSRQYFHLLCHPQVQLMRDVPLLFQIHIIAAFVLFASIPFTKLVHMFSLPVRYPARAPQ